MKASPTDFANKVGRMDILKAFVNLIVLSYLFGVVDVIVLPWGFMGVGPLVLVGTFSIWIPLAGAQGVIPYLMLEGIQFDATHAIPLLGYFAGVVLQIILTIFLLKNLYNAKSVVLRVVQIHGFVIGAFLFGFWFVYVMIIEGFLLHSDLLTDLVLSYPGVVGLGINIAAAFAIGRWRTRLSVSYPTVPAHTSP